MVDEAAALANCTMMIRLAAGSIAAQFANSPPPLKDLAALNSLYLSRNKVADLTPLSGLKKLWSLYLDGNQVKDLTPVAALPFLCTLDISGNHVTTLKPLEQTAALWKI